MGQWALSLSLFHSLCLCHFKTRKTFGEETAHYCQDLPNSAIPTKAFCTDTQLVGLVKTMELNRVDQEGRDEQSLSRETEGFVVIDLVEGERYTSIMQLQGLCPHNK